MARGKKTGGRDFKKGENGSPRGPDKVPRGSIRMLYRHFMENDVDALYEAIKKAAKDPRLALHLAESIANRLEGRSVQAVELSTKRTTIFQLAKEADSREPLEKPHDGEWPVEPTPDAP